jgi:hypothetical protein
MVVSGSRSRSVIAGLFLCAPVRSDVIAKVDRQADKVSPAIDPAATEALNKMGVYLRTLKSFRVQADITSRHNP